MTDKEKLVKICEEETKTIPGSLDRIRERALADGFDVQVSSVGPDVSRYGYECVWEHPEITKHNKEAFILNQGFFSLYWREEGDGTGFGIGGVYPIPGLFLEYGRLGNSYSMKFYQKGEI